MCASQTTITHQAIWVPEPSLPLFEDHFPGSPLVPAYLQLAAIREEASKWLRCSTSQVKVKAMKYKRHLKPGSGVVISFEGRAGVDAREAALTVSLVLDGGVVTTGQLTLV